MIVASILLAFGIEAWWAQRLERADETEALSRLDVEFAQVDSVMREWRQNHQAVLSASEELLAHVGPDGSTSIDTDRIGALLSVVVFTWTLDPPSGVLSSLLASGQLSLIQNEELRAALASWDSLLDDLRGDEQLAFQLVTEQLGPYLDRRVSLRAVESLGDGYSSGTSDFPSGFRDVLADREFENLLHGRAGNTYWILASYDQALDALTRIRSILRHELGVS